MILRPDYINAIEPFIDSPIVKILAGVRRCGKSTILEMVADELIKRGVSKENIIERRYNEIIYEDYSAKDMYSDMIYPVKDDAICFLMNYRK